MMKKVKKSFESKIRRQAKIVAHFLFKPFVWLVGLLYPLLRPIIKKVNKLFKLVNRRRKIIKQSLVKKYPFMQRLWFKSMAMTLVIATVLPTATIIVNNTVINSRYELNDKILSLVGESTVDKDLIKDGQESITYNRAEEEPLSDKQKIMELASSKEDSTGKMPYQAELSKDINKGIKFSDSEGSRTVNLKPLFPSSEPKLEDGRVIYPKGGNEKHVYSFKKNGIKSDIILAEAPKEDSLTYTWELSLGSDLEARTLPNGGIGIYSADSILFGDLKVSDDKSRDLIENAKNNGAKNNLVFELPAPFIVDSNNNKYYDNVSYELDRTNNTLSLKVNNLSNNNNKDDKSSNKSMAYPITIDPTIVVTTTSDLRQKIGDTGNVDYSSDGEIRRGNSYSGDISAWTTDSNSYFSAPRYGHASVAYNGFLYILGGISNTNCRGSGLSSYCNDVQYAPINADGSLGSWTTDTSSYFGNPRYGHTALAYNGYMYVLGGYRGTVTGDEPMCANDSSNEYCNNVQYAPINADGSLGTWTADTSSYFNASRMYHATVAYNGYMYISGGLNGDGLNTCRRGSPTVNRTFTPQCNDNQYAPINADGSLGVWTETTSYTYVREGFTMFAYNNFMYVIGGLRNISGESQECSWAAIGPTTNYCNELTFAPINIDGTLGNWRTDQKNISDIGGIAYHGGYVYNGFLYITGGNTLSSTGCKAAGSSASVYCSEVRYARINADGTIGSWTIDSVSYLTTDRYNHSTVSYNGFVYLTGGNVASTTSCKAAGASASVYCSDVQYAQISTSRGGSWTTSASYTSTARYKHKTIAYNGYLYVIGGSTTNLLSTTLYASISADGTIGAWTEDPDTFLPFSAGRADFGLAAYNGYMYVMGGYQAFSDKNCKNLGNVSYQQCNDTVYATINSNGSLGAWTNTAYFSTPRDTLSAVAYNGYMYILGGIEYLSDTNCKSAGESSSSYCNDVQYAKINSDGTLGSWSTTSYFNFPRYGHTVHAYNGYMYVLGGVKILNDTNCKNTGVSSNDCNDVQYAPISSDGTVGAWTTISYFNTPRQAHISEIFNNVIYVSGGYSSDTTCVSTGVSSGACNDTVYATIYNDGSMSSWTRDQSSYFNTPRASFGSALYNGYLYITGGWQINSSTSCKNSGTNQRCNDVQYLKIDKYGGPGGSFSTSVNYFSPARVRHGVVAYNGYLYVIGGVQNATDSTSCRNDGISGTHCNLTQYAAINTDGTIGTWTSSTYFNQPRGFLVALAYEGYMYVIGGGLQANSTTTTCKEGSASTDRCSDVQYAAINSDGSLGTWVLDTSSYFSVPRRWHMAVAYKGYMYVMGGGQFNTDTACKSPGAPISPVCNDVQYAVINSDGSLGTWTTDASSYFNVPRNSARAVAYNGYMYIVGGNTQITDLWCKNTGVAENLCNDVQYAQINSDGSLGTWITDTSSYFSIPRRDFGMDIYNGYLYIVGGQITNTNTSCVNTGVAVDRCNDVQYVKINSDGSLGDWTSNNIYYSFPRYDFQSVVYNGFLYFSGGWFGTGNSTTDCKTGGANNAICQDTQFTRLASIAEDARYERVFDTKSASNTLSTFTITGNTNCGYTVDYKTAGSDHVLGSNTRILNAKSGTAYTITGGASKRYLMLAITLDDQDCGGTSSIQAISLAYTGASQPPTLLFPENNATGVSTLPEFRLGSANNDVTYLRYKIDVCSNSTCSTIVRTIDQTSSQTGWISQSQQSGTAYSANSTDITQYAIHQYQSSALSASTQYWWRGYAIDPGGGNTWSSASDINTFTTGASEATRTQVIIKGGTTNITGGVNIKP